jgi:hypothetical protein
VRAHWLPAQGHQPGRLVRTLGRRSGFDCGDERTRGAIAAPVFDDALDRVALDQHG